MPDTGNGFDVMVQGGVPSGVLPTFINDVRPMVDGGGTHNTLYHLKRWVDGVSEEELARQGIQPGSWDVPDLKASPVASFFGISAAFDNSEKVIYDMFIVTTAEAVDTINGDRDGFRLLAHFDEISVAELNKMRFDLRQGERLQIFGSDAPGGDEDVALAIGDPMALANLSVPTLEGTYEAAMWADSAAGEFIIASGQVTVTAVPESTTAGWIVLTGVLASRRIRPTRRICI